MGAGGSKSSRVLCVRGGRHQGRRAAAAPLTPKGFFPVCVGLGDESKRFVIHTALHGDADLLELLCISAEEYGFSNPGVLKIPCDAKSFEERMLVKDKHRMQRIMVAQPSISG